jgi:MFS family permease
VGVALGSLFGGKVINAYGRKYIILVSNIFIILFSGISCASLSFYLIVTIRTFFGVAVGFLLAGAPKIVIETVPAHLLGHGFGSFANIFTFFFVSIVVALNFANTDFMNEHGYEIIYSAPIPFTIIAIFGLTYFYKESPAFIIESYNCPRCEAKQSRCATCREHICDALKKQATMTDA